MTLQEFIALWQAQPFRAFRLHAAKRVHTVAYPGGVALLSDLRLIVAEGETTPEPFSLEAVEKVDVFGPALSLADVFAGIPPEVLARNAQRLSDVQLAAASGAPTEEAPPVAADPGRVALQGQCVADGSWAIHATVTTAEGREIFQTGETNWSVHGVEPFENGTALFLHHAGDRGREQRVIVWPPDRGTFESFAESRSLVELREELVRLDRRLTVKPVRAREPTTAYFKKIHPAYPAAPVDPMAGFFGEEAEDRDMDQFEFHLVPRTLSNGKTVENPCLVDVPGEDFFFNLTDTNWDADFVRHETSFEVGLRYGGRADQELRVSVDPFARTVVVGGDSGHLPVGFVERVLLNYSLYEDWPAMRGLLRHGPPPIKTPEVVVSLAAGYGVEFWPGEPQFPLPFLQPRLVAPGGEALLDFRGTAWAALLGADRAGADLTLTLVSHEKDASRWAHDDRLVIKLPARVVTVPGRSGATTVGMIQAMVRHVRGVKWLKEELASWLAKGKTLPVPAECGHA